MDNRFDRAKTIPSKYTGGEGGRGPGRSGWGVWVGAVRVRMVRSGFRLARVARVARVVEVARSPGSVGARRVGAQNFAFFHLLLPFSLFFFLSLSEGLLMDLWPRVETLRVHCETNIIR